MNPITQSYISQLAKTHPEHYPVERKRTLETASSMDYLGVDGTGLIKSYYWGGIGSPRYDKTTDYGENMMYIKASVKGIIGDLPERAGIILYNESYSRVGIYMENGWVIECISESCIDGVIKTKISDFNWEYWFECPGIDYSE